MATSYPSALDSYTTLVDNSDDVLAADPNDRGDAIEALQTKLGVDSSAVATSIDYFLKHASGAYRTHQHDGTSDDGAKLDWDNCWTDAVHDHSSAGEGGNITLTTGVTGALPIANGGTNATTIAQARTNLGLSTMAEQASHGVSITGGTITGITDLAIVDGGTGSSSAANTANGVVLLGSDGYLPNSSCDTTALKTTLAEMGPYTTYTLVTLPGGTYGFAPQFRNSSDSNNCIATLGHPTADGPVLPSSYGTYAAMYSGVGSVYAQIRYVTASGTDMWIFLLLDKVTKELKGGYQAQDHPAYGNGGDFDKVPHPFISYNEDTDDIILLDKETCINLKQESKITEKSILTLINEEYKINMDTKILYQPLHSGKYLTTDKKQVKQMVNNIPAYIEVRGITRLSREEKTIRIKKTQEKEERFEQDRIKKEQTKILARNKLKTLGLLEEELAVLFV